jgi:signal transduction histidine kinase
MLGDQVAAALLAIETLSSLSRGIYPRLLSEQGLMAAVRSAVMAGPLPVAVEACEIGRLHPTVEAALYFCCMEAVQNATKHSGADRITVRMEKARGRWRLTVRDDGSGFDPAVVGEGAGLANMRDRLDAVGGVVTVDSRPGLGTTVTAALTATDLTVVPEPPAVPARVAG